MVSGRVVVENENEGQGVELIDKEASITFRPRLFPGDLIVFDNIKLRHRVPQLDKPRISVGLRNFDHMPLHFARREEFFLGGAKYRKIPEGFVSENADCAERYEQFLQNEWPELKSTYGSYV